MRATACAGRPLHHPPRASPLRSRGRCPARRDPWRGTRCCKGETWGGVTIARNGAGPASSDDTLLVPPPPSLQRRTPGTGPASQPRTATALARARRCPSCCREGGGGAEQEVYSWAEHGTHVTRQDEAPKSRPPSPSPQQRTGPSTCFRAPCLCPRPERSRRLRAPSRRPPPAATSATTTAQGRCRSRSGFRLKRGARTCSKTRSRGSRCRRSRRRTAAPSSSWACCRRAGATGGAGHNEVQCREHGRRAQTT